MFELFLVRHGESLRNIACELAHRGLGEALEEQLSHPCNESLWPLTDKGRVQSLLAGKWIAEQTECIEAIYCSPYVRAWETARKLHLRRPIHLDGRLREREWGEFEPGAYSAREYVADLAECSDLRWKSRFPGAESIHDLIPSTAELLRQLRTDHPSGSLVLVTHGGRMQAFEHLLEQSGSPRRYANCSVLQYRFESDATFVRVAFPAHSELPAIPWQSVWQPVRIEA